MMSLDYPKNSTKFWQLNRLLKGFIRKRRKINNLQVYIESSKVKDFEKQVLQALQAQFKTLK